MVTDTANKKNRIHGRLHPSRLFYLLLLSPAVASADDLELKPGVWDITPRITLSETYTDNIRLESGPDKEGDLVTEISPGVNVSKEGGRSRVELDYEMQGLLFADNSSKNDINHKLYGVGQFELKPDWFYLDTLATYSQRNVSQSGRLSLDTVTGSSDLSDVGTLRISPYLRHDFGGQVETLARYTHDETYYSGGGASDSSADTLDLNLASGRFWRILTWSLTHHHSELNRESSSDATFQSTQGDVSYRLTDTFHVLARAGNEDNEYQTSRQIENGSYFAVGALWRPSRYYGLEALYGDKYKQGTVMLNPTRRTDFNVTYTNREVGTILGPSWDARLRHRGPWMTLSGTYHEDTTTVQQAEIYNILDVAIADYFNFLPEDFSCDPINLNQCLSITDEVIERKRATGNVKFDTGRSTINGRIFNERRLFLTSQTRERVNGGDASWRWRYTGVTDFILRGGTINTVRNQGAAEDDLWYAQWTVQHDFTPKTKGSVELRHTEQDSTQASNEYKENRITVKMRMEF